ncbi:MAG: cytochrome c3 family protein [Chloroflexi bacterium]|nr:cytochrome c3 family protein [Chloroflexota bacterium]
MQKKRVAAFMVMAVGMGLGGLVTLLLVLFVARAWWTTPFEVLGFGGAPTQPIAFPHTVHAGVDIILDADGNPKLDTSNQEMNGLGLGCTFCHRNVDKGAAASIPPVEQCIFCHKSIGTDLPEVAKLINAWDNKEAVVWERVHRLPDSVRFVHEPHIRFFTEPGNLMPSGEQATLAANVCSTCHGDVAQMEEVKQVRSLKMGDCVDCHRNYSAPTDCTTCHY